MFVLQCDIGLVYDAPSHSLLNKWLLLADPDDSMAGAKGYLKICATVLGAGDDAPVSGQRMTSLTPVWPFVRGGAEN